MSKTVFDRKRVIHFLHVEIVNIGYNSIITNCMFSNPKSNLDQFALTPGMLVADLGVGAGYHALEAAKAVGPEGRVFGVDVQKELVLNLKKSAEKEGLDNLEVIWGDIEKVGGTKIKDSIIDACLVTSVLFQLEEKDGFVQEVARILKPGGKVLVIDWMDSFAGLGPHREQIFTQDQAENLFIGAGFEIEKRIDAGDHHYGFIAKK
jgi:ubiquinone/menaquinone biosynthesis C-methylase UbiE